MKYYRMAEKVREDSTLLLQVNNPWTRFMTGQLFPANFEEPFIAKLDDETLGRRMQTLYTSPAAIGTRQFHQDLLETGVNNIEAKKAIIRDNVNQTVFEGYLLLNIIGRVSCADMSQSEYHDLGDSMHIIDKLVIDPQKVQGLELFLVHEDSGCIVISERVHDHLQARAYADIYFEELQTV